MHKCLCSRQAHAITTSLVRTHPRAHVSQDYGQHDGLPNTLYRRTVDARKRIAAELASRVTAAVAQYKAGALSSPVAAAMFDAYEELGADLEDPEVTHTIVNTVIELMFAGTGTTAHSLGSVAQTLAAHPDWFARAQREQDRLQAAHGPELTGKVRRRGVVPFLLLSHSEPTRPETRGARQVLAAVAQPGA